MKKAWNNPVSYVVKILGYDHPDRAGYIGFKVFGTSARNPT